MPTQPCIVGTARLNNFRLDYVPAAMEQIRRTRVRIVLDGVEVRTRVSGATIRDVLNEQPNECRLTFDGVPPIGGGPLPLAPTVGEDLRITIDASAPRLLFAGTLQTTDQSYEGRPTWTGYPCTAIDYTTRLNYRRPFGTWVEISATTIAQSIVARFAPEFGVSHIDGGLDSVSITFDGTEEFIACLGRLASLIGGYTKVDDMDVYLFTSAVVTTIPNGPIVTPTFGAGVAGGVHGWAYTWVTALGETTPSRVTSATLGVPTPPTVTPTVVVLIPGTGITRYVYTFGGVAGNYADLAHESAPSPASADVVGGAGASTNVTVSYVPVPGPPYVRLWRSTNGGPFQLCQFGSNFNTTGTLILDDQNYDLGLTLPAPGIGGTLQASLANIAVGPAGTLSRKVYRTVAGGSQLKLLTTLANNTTLTYLDAVADGSLGANAPTADTSGLAVRPDTPDPIDADHRPLDDPPMTVHYDDSQLRTRVYGKGHGESLLSDVNVGENTLPIASAVMFNAAGGRAIVGTTADGATSIQISYTTIQNPNVGALVGTGAVPSTAPLAMAQAGTGLGTGTYRYAYTDQTAAGESLPSPFAEVAVGVVANPATAPTVNKPTAGTGPDAGSHWYKCTFYTATGETLPGPVSGQVITGDVPIPPAEFWNFTCNIANVGAQTDRTYYGYAVTFVDAAGGETTPYRVPNPWYLTQFNHRLEIFGIPVSPDPAIVRRRIYRTKSDGTTDSAPGVYGPLYFAFEMDNNVGTSAVDGRADSTLGGPPPSVNTAKNTTRTVPLTTIPIGGASVIGRRLYRTKATDGTVFYWVANIPDNSTTSYSDTLPDAGVGGTAPVSNTAGGGVNQVALSGIAIGQTGTTGRKIYRTAANATQLKFLKTIADNTTLTTTDAAADGTLGANVPIGDTSGLKQPEGQVNAGSTSMVIASTLNFSAGGGWVLLGGGQVVRYGGFGAGNVLSGIPPTGAGSIRTSVLYGTPVVGVHTLAGVVPTTAGPPPSLPDPTVAPVGGYNSLADGPPYPFVSGDAARNWMYTWVSAAGETRPSPPSTLTAPLAGIGPYCGNPYPIAIGPPGTIARRVYRTSAGGTVFKLAGTIADNVTLVFNDHTADGALGAVAPTVNTAVIGGVPFPLAKGSPVNIFVQRDDLAAQAEAAARESTPTYTSTGIHEHQIVDERRAEASLIEQCDADLVLFARPIVTYVLATHDVKAKSGKTLHIELPGYPVGDFVIQDVTIDEIDVSPGTPPRFTVTASSVAFSLPDVLRRLISAEQAG